MRYNGLKVSAISAYFSIVVIIAIVGSVVAIIMRLWKLDCNMNHETIQEFNLKYSALTSDLRETSSNRIVKYWKALNLIRWFLTLALLTNLTSYPGLQIKVLIIFSWLQQILILKCRPYESKLKNVLTFINEFAVSVYLYFSLLLSDYLECQFTLIEDALQAKVVLSWILSLLLCVVIGINFIAMVAQKIMKFKTWLSRRKSVQASNSEDRVVKL
jgi:hypothetical protein